MRIYLLSDSLSDLLSDMSDRCRTAIRKPQVTPLMLGLPRGRDPMLLLAPLLLLLLLLLLPRLLLRRRPALPIQPRRVIRLR